MIAISKIKQHKTIALLIYVVFLAIVNILFIVNARYVFGNATQRSASAASFVFLVTPSNNKNLVIDCTKDLTKDIWTISYPFSVSNSNGSKTCEVDVKYDITITLPISPPIGMTMKLQSGEQSINPSSIHANNKYCFNSISSFEAAVTGTHSYTIIFSVDAKVIVDSIDMNNITIDISSYQVN